MPALSLGKHIIQDQNDARAAGANLVTVYLSEGIGNLIYPCRRKLAFAGQWQCMERKRAAYIVYGAVKLMWRKFIGK
jgi:hypothetical protein